MASGYTRTVPQDSRIVEYAIIPGKTFHGGQLRSRTPATRYAVKINREQNQCGGLSVSRSLPRVMKRKIPGQS